MKKLLLLILSIAFISSITYSQSGWFSQSIIVNYPFLAVYFVDSQTGWTTCTHNFIGTGTIYKTTNGGSNWVNFGSAGNDIYSMSFINSSTGYMTGHYGGILYVVKTTNGGTNFINSNNYDEYGKAWSIYFINALTGWFAGYSNTYHKGFVAKTNDGGSYWTEYNPVNQDIKSVYFYNNLTGWAVGDSGIVVKSTDGGVTWSSQQVSLDYFLKVKFYDINTGWILSGNKVFKTTNGGSYWSSIYTNTTISFKSFTFMDLNTGWIVGYKTNPQNEGTILKTTNGGINWIEQSAYTNNFLNAVYFINLNTGWTVGNNGTILKTITGGVITNIGKVNTNIPSIYSLLQNYPNPFNPITKIKFDIPKTSNIKLTVYDVTGKEISILVNEKVSPGSYETEFNGEKYSSGIYFYRLETSNFIQTNKMILLK